MKHLNLKKNAAKGFSLVEMLVVIAVIGVIAAIAIPSIGSINSSAQTATYERNAQSVMSVYQSGLAAGANWNSTTVGTLATASDLVNAVMIGTTGSGTFSGTTFKCPGINTADIASIAGNIGGTAASGFTYTASN